jgi:hypothetical protein
MGCVLSVISAFDITTSCELFDPERLFAIVGELNADGGRAGRVGIELYPTRHSPIGPLRAGRILQWQRRYDAKVVRVHLEFVHDKSEIRYIIRRADERRSFYARLFLRALYWMMADASSGLGLRLARGLGVGINVHSNVIATLARQSLLPGIAAALPFVWAENNIKADYLYVNGPVLYDPGTIVDEQIVPYGLDGLLLGMDHLIDHFPQQGIDPYEVLDDERVRTWTKAIHLASRGHGVLRVGDPEFQRLFKNVARTPFRYPVRIVLDYSALAVWGYSFREEVRLFRNTLDWIGNLVNVA